MKYFIIIFLFLTSFFNSKAQERPRLVVGIVVDQMKQDYLLRFNKNFTDDGFKKLMNNGTFVKNMHFNYVPTNTGPGHASVYTGTTPAIHGIISNSWYSEEEGRIVYCVGDSSFRTVGTNTREGQASPHRLLTTTITDELRLSTNMEAKVVSISIKDRGSILPGGHTGQAYWYDYQTGDFVTSTFYRDDLPKWLEKFNKQKLSDKYLEQTWDRLLSADAYIADDPRQAEYEVGFQGKSTPDFPYELSKYRGNYDYGLLTSTPFGNQILTDLAKSALEGEELGKDNVTDFLAISYSSTDIAGHNFGPQSQEVEDIYYRLDRNIEELINYLDQQVGAGNYVLFLTADHAVADVPLYLEHKKIPAGIFNVRTTLGRLNSLMYSLDLKDGISNISNYQIYLSDGVENKNDVASRIAELLIDKDENLAYAWTAQNLMESDFGGEGIKGLVTRGFHPKRSGDVVAVPYPGWFASGNSKGTTHGSPFSYDTHVPMLWYGWKIPKKTTVRPYVIPDIAVTLSMLLDIRLPNGSTGKPIMEIFEE